jgi:predicted unusual protein kinase regulating ubiquinone biosynthesis (AarF/ABC1/UbiB family)
MFASFDEQPLAARTIAQVHPARCERQEVVVKIVRPGIRALIERDLEVLYALAELANATRATRTACGPSRSCANTRRRSSTSST